MSNENPILKQYTRKEIAEKLGVSHQTVINWFNDNHPSSMPVKYLDTLGFVVASREIYNKTLEELLEFVGPVFGSNDEEVA
jgi:transcriptional regulator with XRE-family HTH domain